MTKPLKYRVSVDTGVNALGWAVWAVSSWNNLEQPVEAGIIEVPNKLLRTVGTKWRIKAEYLLEQYESIVLEQYNLTRQFVEWPENRDGVVGNAASKKGHVSQLAYMCGRHEQLGNNYAISTELVPVSEWKQSLPKPIVELRIRNAIKPQDKAGFPFETHAWDAVGIGLHKKGFLLDTNEVYGSKQW